MKVPQHLTFFDRGEDFVAPVAHALVRAASTLVSMLGVVSHWLRLGRFVGQPILAAAGFQPALGREREFSPSHWRRSGTKWRNA
jgi:hypothetical protein